MHLRIPAMLFALCSILCPSAVGAAEATPFPEYKPAPLNQPRKVDRRGISGGLEKFKTKVRTDCMTTKKDLDQAVVEATGKLGVMADLASLTGADQSFALASRLSEAFGNVGACVTVYDLLGKQLDGESTVGVEMLYQTAKFLGAKITGGAAMAGASLIQYELETIGRQAYRCVDERFWRYYVDYHLSERSPSDLIKGGGSALARRLDSFWDSDVCQGIRGWSALESQYKKDPGGHRAAYRRKFIEECILPKLRERVTEDLSMAEDVVVRIATVSAQADANYRITVKLPDIVDRGGGARVTNTECLLLRLDRETLKPLLVARGRLGEAGVTELTFPLGRLLKDDGTMDKELGLELRPPPGHGFFQRHKTPGTEAVTEATNATRTATVSLDLGKRAVVTGTSTGATFEFPGIKYVHAAVPVTVELTGKGVAVRHLSYRSTPLIAAGLGSKPQTGDLQDAGGGRYQGQVPSGFVTFSCGIGMADRELLIGSDTVTASEKLEFRRPTEVSVDAALAMPGAPELAAGLQAVLAATRKISTAAKESAAREQEERAIGALLGRLLKYESMLNDVCARARRQVELARASQELKPDEVTEICSKAEERRNAAERLLKEAAAAKADLVKKHLALREEVAAEVKAEEKELKDQYGAAAKELAAALDKASGIRARIDGSFKEILNELRNDHALQLDEPASAACLKKLRARARDIDVAGLERVLGEVRSLEKRTTIAAARCAAFDRRRDMSEPALRWLYCSRAKPSQALGRYVQAANSCGVSRRAEAALSIIARRHSQRVANEAEAARLVREARSLILQQDPLAAIRTMLQKKAFEFQNRLAAALRAPEGQRAALLAGILADLDALLDANRNLVGDLRTGENHCETPYAKLLKMRERIYELATSGVAFHTKHRFVMLEKSVWRYLRDAVRLREGAAGTLLEMERDLAAPAGGAIAFCNTLVTDRERIRKMIAEGKQLGAVDLAKGLDRLDQAHAMAAKLPAGQDDLWLAKVEDAALEICSDGKLERYAAGRKLPLVIFEEVEEQRYPNPVTRKLDSAFYRTEPPDGAYSDWTPNLKARIAGLPPGAPVWLVLDTGDIIRSEKKLDGGFWMLFPALGDPDPRPLILGAPGGAKLLRWSCLRQIRFRTAKYGDDTEPDPDDSNVPDSSVADNKPDDATPIKPDIPDTPVVPVDPVVPVKPDVVPVAGNFAGRWTVNFYNNATGTGKPTHTTQWNISVAGATAQTRDELGRSIRGALSANGRVWNAKLLMGGRTVQQFRNLRLSRDGNRFQGQWGGFEMRGNAIIGTKGGAPNPIVPNPVGPVAAPGQVTVELKSSSQPGTCVIAPNGTLLVKVAERAGTGYGPAELASKHTGVLRLLGTSTQSMTGGTVRGRPLAGGGKWKVFRFQVVGRSGSTAKLIFEKRRPWKGGGVVKYSLDLTVR